MISFFYRQKRCLVLGLLLTSVPAYTEPAEAATYRKAAWPHHRLPNSSVPYRKLKVEIDTVEGAGPTPHEQAALSDFLASAVDKPGGIQVRVNDVIALSSASAHPPTRLALQHIDGPEDEDSAFIYILYYDSSKLATTVPPQRPHFQFFPYPCAIFIDRAYARSFTWAKVTESSFSRAILLHEVGHALGLSQNPSHSVDGHCTYSNCLMNTQISFRISRLLTARAPLGNTTLCAFCRHDLENMKLNDLPDSRMLGPYFIQDFASYQMLTLPGFIYVHFGPRTEIQRIELEGKRREALMATHQGGLWTGTNTFDPAKHIESLISLAKGQNSALSGLLRDLFTLCAEQAESSLERDVDWARRLTSPELIAAAFEFPDLQQRLQLARARAKP